MKVYILIIALAIALGTEGCPETDTCINCIRQNCKYLITTEGQVCSRDGGQGQVLMTITRARHCSFLVPVAPPASTDRSSASGPESTTIQHFNVEREVMADSPSVADGVGLNSSNSSTTTTTSPAIPSTITNPTTTIPPLPAKSQDIPITCELMEEIGSSQMSLDVKTSRPGSAPGYTTATSPESLSEILTTVPLTYSE